VSLGVTDVSGLDPKRSSLDASDFVTECSECSKNSSSTDRMLNEAQLKVRIQALGREEREELYKRIESGKRALTRVDQLWATYRQSSVKVQRELRRFLKNLLGVQ
jgi:hypothetical protein